MSGLRTALYRFFYGRNGIDALYRFLMLVCIVLIVINMFVRSFVLYYIELAVLAYAVWRSLSKNVGKRQSENARYTAMRDSVRRFFMRQINRIRYHKTKAYRKCPACKCNLCLPRKKGVHTVKCPSCSNRFDVKI